MSPVSDPQFSRLPLNDTLYRLVGAAKILPKIDEMETPRVQLWFAEIDNHEPERLAYARRASGAYSLLSVIGKTFGLMIINLSKPQLHTWRLSCGLLRLIIMSPNVLPMPGEPAELIAYCR